MEAERAIGKFAYGVVDRPPLFDDAVGGADDSRSVRTMPAVNDDGFGRQFDGQKALHQIVASQFAGGDGIVVEF